MGIQIKVNDSAPDFEAFDQDGRLHKLSDYKGKIVLLYFYPKDNTPGCTIEACSLRDNYSALKKELVILGVSGDSQDSHRKFADKFNLPAIHFFKIRKGQIYEIEAIGTMMPYGLSSNWE